MDDIKPMGFKFTYINKYFCQHCTSLKRILVILGQGLKLQLFPLTSDPNTVVQILKMKPWIEMFSAQTGFYTYKLLALTVLTYTDQTYTSIQTPNIWLYSKYSIPSSSLLLFPIIINAALPAKITMNKNIAKWQEEVIYLSVVYSVHSKLIEQTDWIQN